VVTSRIDLSSLAAPGGSCTALVSASAAALAGEGGSGTATLTLPSSCSWTASSGASWLQVSPASGTGGAGLTVTASPNPGAARTAVVSAAGKTFSVTQGPDKTLPTGTLAIAGDPAATRSLAVTLSLTAADPNGVPSMCVSNAVACTSWVPFSRTKAWTLAGGGSGARKVYVRFKDGAGNVSAQLSRSVVYDVTAPLNGTLTATASDGQIAFSWPGFRDAGVGMGTYRLVRSTTAVPAAGCAASASTTVVYSGGATSYADTGVQNGASYHYRLCAVDLLGNTSAGLTKDARPAPDFTAPVGTVAIREGAKVNVLAVNLDLTAVDTSPVTMCVSNGTTCAATAWQPFAATRAWTLAAGASGTRVVRVWFKDAWNNVTKTPVSASVVYDVKAPAGGALTGTASASTGSVALAWSGFSDPLSGVSSYTLVAAPGTAPPSCAAGVLLYQGPARAFTHTGLAPGQTWGYRVCATDGMGNRSPGVAKVVKVPLT